MTALEQYLGGLSDKRVGVIGAGVSNMPLIRMLRAAGVRVTVHDKKEPTELGDGYATLATLGVVFLSLSPLTSSSSLSACSMKDRKSTRLNSSH